MGTPRPALDGASTCWSTATRDRPGRAGGGHRRHQGLGRAHGRRGRHRSSLHLGLVGLPAAAANGGGLSPRAHLRRARRSGAMGPPVTNQAGSSPSERRPIPGARRSQRRHRFPCRVPGPERDGCRPRDRHASGTATIDDGTGQVRVGGPAAADALAILEPGDAIEVTGLVREDDLGLFIEADPAILRSCPAAPVTRTWPVVPWTASPTACLQPRPCHELRKHRFGGLRRVVSPRRPDSGLVACWHSSLWQHCSPSAGIAQDWPEAARRSSVLPRRLAAAMARWPGRSRRKVP
jgi:hypothetical protein